MERFLTTSAWFYCNRGDAVGKVAWYVGWNEQPIVRVFENSASAAMQFENLGGSGVAT